MGTKTIYFCDRCDYETELESEVQEFHIRFGAMMDINNTDYMIEVCKPCNQELTLKMVEIIDNENLKFSGDEELRLDLEAGT